MKTKLASQPIDTIKSIIKNLWEVLYKDSLQACEEADDFLQQIRKEKNTANRTSVQVDWHILELGVLHVLGFALYHSGDIPKAFAVAHELRETASQVQSSEYNALAEHLIAKTEIQNGLWDEAKERLLKVSDTLSAVGNHEFLQSVLIDISNIAQEQNNYELAIEMLMKAEADCKAHPVNKKALSVIRSNMSDVYVRVGNLEKAKEYIYASIEEAKNAHDTQRYANALLRLSNIYAREGQFLKQIEVLNQSIEILVKKGNDHQIAIRRIALGTAYMNTNDFPQALEKFREALPALEQKSDKKNIAILHQRLGMLFSHSFFADRDSETAQAHFKSAEDIALEMSMPHFRASVVESRAESLASFGKFEEAFSMLKLSSELEKHVINEQSLRSLHELETRHKVAIKEKEIELLEANNKMLELERSHLQEQLSMNNQYLFMYKKELNNFKSDIHSITKQLDKAENIVRKVKMKLRESTSAQATWESYVEIFSKVHPDFQSTLKSSYPSLTTMELKVCVLIRAGLLSEEIAEILSLSERTIENKRFSIRNKLGLKDREKLDKFLSQY